MKSHLKLRFAVFVLLFVDLSITQRVRLTTRAVTKAPSTSTTTTEQTTTSPKSMTVVFRQKSGSFKFPDDLDVPSDDPIEIPLELRREFDNVGDVSEFFKFIDNSTFDDLDPFEVDGRTGVSANGERDAAIPAKAASCIPEQQIVSLMQSTDPTVLYYPSCTRIERCGGCCNSELLSCQPTKTETVVLQVVKTQYSGGKKLKYAGKEKIPVEKHLACKCQCKVKEEDCKGNQIYNPGACRCECKNNGDRMNCLAEASNRFWDSNSCMCRCRLDVHSRDGCSTGFFFSDETCKCEPFPLRRNDVWAVEDDYLARNPAPVKPDRVSTLQPARVTRKSDYKEEEKDEKEEKKGPMERFTFNLNWRNQYYGRLTTTPTV